MHITFPIASTFSIVQLTTEEDGKVLEPSIFRYVGIQDLCPTKFKDIEDSSSEIEDERQRQNKTRKELTFTVQKVAKCYDEYVENYKHVTMEIHLLTKHQ